MDATNVVRRHDASLIGAMARAHRIRAMKAILLKSSLVTYDGHCYTLVMEVIVMMWLSTVRQMC